MTGLFAVCRRLPALVVAAGLLAGCTSAGWPWQSASPTTGASVSPSPSAAPSPSATPPSSATPRSTAPITYATGATDLVIRAASGGGLLPLEMRVTEMPDLSLFGDGSAIRVAAQGWGPDEPLLPKLVVATVTPEGMARILAAARDVGLLGSDRHYEMRDVYDLWTTWFLVVADGQTHQVSAYALGFSEEDRFAPAEDLPARHALADFFGRIHGLRDWLGADTVSADEPYVPRRLRVFLTPDLERPAPGGSSVPVTPAPGQDVRAWPLATAPGSFGALAGASWAPWRCGVLETAEAAPFAFGTATNATRWAQGGVLYRLAIRPLLPDEEGCPDLG